MLKDRRGLEVSTDSATALAALDDAIDGFVTFRADASLRLSEATKADPDLVLGHVFKAGMALLSCNVKNTERAHAALTRAGSLIARANPRERGHLEAMAAWASGDLDGALRVWEGILVRQPTDLLALRLAHYHYFWLGRTARMLDSVTAAKRGWQGDTPGRSWVASMEAFSLEECGEYEQAELEARIRRIYDGIGARTGLSVGGLDDPDGRLASLARSVAAALPGLSGLYGVDVVMAASGPVVVEVNPRLTTAYAGLREALDLNPAVLVPPFAEKSPAPRFGRPKAVELAL